jgi:hypothetical protein
MKYTIRVEVQAYRDYVVEADDQDQALELAYDEYNSESSWDNWEFSEAELEAVE